LDKSPTILSKDKKKVMIKIFFHRNTPWHKPNIDKIRKQDNRIKRRMLEAKIDKKK
jgi:hypothetical protein